MDDQTQQTQMTTESMQPQTQKRVRRKPFIIMMIVCVVVLSGIGLVSMTNKTSQETVLDIPVSEPIEALANEEKAVITIQPESQTVKIAQQFTNTILLDAKSYPITVVRIVLQYDPTYVSLSSFEPGSFYKNPTVLTKTIDNTKGAALLTLGSLVPQDGKETIASFSAFPKTVSADAPAFLTFSTSSYAYVSTKDQQIDEKNVLTTFGESAVTIVP